MPDPTTAITLEKPFQSPIPRVPGFFLGCLLLASLSASALPPADFSWTVGNVETSYASQFGTNNDQCNNLYWDAVTANYHYIGSYPSKVLYSGATADTMSTRGDVSITGLHGGDARGWHNYIWRNAADGLWHGFIHIEYAYNVNSHDHLMKVGLAHSSDLFHWAYGGDILTVHDPSSAGRSDGCGNPTFMEDESYFYLLHDDVFSSNIKPQSRSEWVTVSNR